MLRQRTAPFRSDRAGSRGDEAFDFAELVRGAVIHLSDLPYLQTHPLSRSIGGTGTGSFARARALQRDLTEAMASLALDPTIRARHRDQRLLHLRYVDGLEVAEVCGRLGISRAEYYRQHQRAFEALVSLLGERWEVRPTLVPLRAGNPSPDRGRPPGLSRYLTSLLGRQRDFALAEELLRHHRW